MKLADSLCVPCFPLLNLALNYYIRLQEDWIELESKKFGPFWLNKTTGEVILHLQQRGETATTVGSSDPVTPATEREVESRRESTREKPQLKSRKKKVSSHLT